MSVVIEDVEVIGKAGVYEKGPNIPSLFKLSQMDDADKYFKALDASDQALVIDRYNNKQETIALKLKAKATKAALVAFYQWLSRDLWGDPSPEHLLAFAQTLLSKQQG